MDQKEGYQYQQPPPSYESSTGNYQQQAYTPGPPPVVPPQPAPTTTHHVTYHMQPTVVITPVGPHPVYVTCPSCRQYTLTRMEYEPSSKTHLMAALLCLVGCFICACLPYCMDSCMNGNHYCSNCGAFIGTYSN
ncbi:unnamed protein product [Hermetia illucens]|uniref:LITAF domain-containing protein n=1 Tax=Hermetia illucens TaxID=343691 RepID=A0A7R8U9Q0_HERIL|nr:lipopolysaccharide-induced tumor necrosis factor-alpha factor homolog [Hermetia illucens]CAD7076765.1 unnamed protein product [Hermetia illucens]